MEPNITIEGDNNNVNIPETEKVKKLWSRKWDRRMKTTMYIFVISVALIIGGYLNSIIFPHSYINDNLFAEHFKPLNTDVDNSSNYVQAYQSYQKGKYSEAIKYFTEIAKKDSLTISDKFYFAISYCSDHKYYKAINLLKPISCGENGYNKFSDWYLALCYLKIDDNDKAIVQFDKLIKTNDSPYRKKSIEILEKIKASQ